MRVFVLAVLFGLSQAQTAESKEMVARGLGTTTCAEFANLYRADPKGTEIAFASWAQGFMSGWNFALMDRGSYRDLGSEDSDYANFEIRQYCDAHPLAGFVQAVMAHFLDLPVKPMPHPK